MGVSGVLLIAKDAGPLHSDSSRVTFGDLVRLDDVYALVLPSCVLHHLCGVIACVQAPLLTVRAFAALSRAWRFLWRGAMR